MSGVSDIIGAVNALGLVGKGYVHNATLAAAGPIYPDIATGRAAVANNAFFRVIGDGVQVAENIYQRLTSTTQTLIAQAPATTRLMQISNLPRHLGNQPVVTAANGATEVTSFDASLKAQKRSISITSALYSYVRKSVTGTIGSDTYPQNVVVVGWINGNPGFTSKGLLTRLLIPPGGTVGSNATIQAWVVRPTGALPASGTASFSLVSTIGEITAAPNTDWREFRNLAIEVEASDCIALRGINTGLRYGSAAAEYATDYYIFVSLADMTLAALAGGVSGTLIAGGRKFDLQADIVTGAAAIRSLRVETDGNNPLEYYRSPDAPWAGKKIGAVGTSITASGADSTGLGYIGRVQPWLQCNMDNQGVGSSGIVWNGTRALSLGATRAELTAAGFDPNQSYETKMIGKAKDLWIFDHGLNDGSFTIGTSADTTPATFWGAYKRVIGALLAENPAQQFCFLTPISLYNPNYPNFNANTAAIRTAMLAMSDYFGAPILDWTGKTGMGAYAPSPATLSADGTHPLDLVHIRAARMLYHFVRGI